MPTGHIKMESYAPVRTLFASVGLSTNETTAPGRSFRSLQLKNVYM